MGVSETALAPAVGLEAVRKLLLDSVRSPLTRVMYAKALDDFFAWWEGQGRPPFVRATVRTPNQLLYVFACKTSRRRSQCGKRQCSCSCW
jgi:hypothetical protein